MARALELDPQNVQALVGSAILELCTATPGAHDAPRRRENAINTMSMAYHVDQDNPTALNTLANHYFWTWSPVKAKLQIRTGSQTGTLSVDLKGVLRPGDLIRVGSDFRTAVGEDVFDGKTLELRDEYPGPSGDVRLYKKDYRKVRRSTEI